MTETQPNLPPPVEYIIFAPPKPIGAWIIGYGGYGFTQFAMYVKPTGEQIKNTEELLGWKWKDLT